MRRRYLVRTLIVQKHKAQALPTPGDGKVDLGVNPLGVVLIKKVEVVGNAVEITQREAKPLLGKRRRAKMKKATKMTKALSRDVELSSVVGGNDVVGSEGLQEATVWSHSVFRDVQKQEGYMQPLAHV